MGEEVTSGGSKVTYIILAFVFVALIIGASAWFYATGRSKPEPLTTTTPTKTTAPVTDDKVAAQTEINTNVADLDDELATINQEEEEGAEDDTVNL